MLLAYQSSLPGGIPNTHDALKICYDNFCALTPDIVRPQFTDVYKALKICRLIMIRDGKLRFPKNVAVDHTVATRAHNSAFSCALCRISCTGQASLDAHLNGRAHIAMERVRELTGSVQDNEKDKGGITITRENFGTVQVGTTVSRNFIITNTAAGRRTLTACELVRKVTSLQLSDSQHVCGGLRTHSIPGSGGSYSITLTCQARDLGYIRDVLIFRFHGFNIYRYLTIHVDSPGSAVLAPTAPYRRPPPVHKEVPAEIVPGVPLELPPAINPYKQLPHYSIPAKLVADLNRGTPPRLGVLGTANYITYFSTLLHIEEIQMEVDIRQYDMTSQVTKYMQHYILKVPGLAENRPSVLKGDSVFLKFGGTEYEGVVHVVNLENVSLRFSKRFDPVFNPAQKYDVRFSFKRVPLRRMHEAVHQTGSQRDYPINPPILFPADNMADVAPILALANGLNPINRSLNQQQLRAVAAIMIGSSGPSPYIVFGPPGTGKTMTIVEAIGQIYRKKEPVRILACAPSNTAADLIAQRLLTQGVQKMDIYRFNAFNRSREDVPEEVMGISSYNPETGTFEQLLKADITKKRIVVSTCINAGQLYAMSIQPFTHVFVDEAGQAMEPECIVSISSLVTDKTTVVLAGDPKQLGPVIRSPYAILDGQGLARSLLERLISLHPYRRDVINFAPYGNYNIRLITKLVNNYRSHPDILTIPNQLFYDKELVPMANIALRTAMCNWEGLPTKGFPLIFHGLEGKDEREGNSPSWFNISECLQVFTYVRKLLENRAPKISAKDIGIITPYRKQAQKIRTYLQANHCPGIMVGSVEQFQGQERLIIIISAVRSNKEFVEFDFKHNLGFLKNPKRFNVAITRPQALLIVIGNPRVLVHDPNWARLLWHIVDHGGYTGSDLPTRVQTDTMDQIIAVFDRLQVGGEEDTNAMEPEDPEWRPLN
eukprot:Phypoly_transcript_00193.p1 GENE.Phypoly_transcript_00193~~Phypoly_transcript_00193.p1  ORF type:complete len:940 (+),score=127.19 Phypoly_transcript_00193:1526-4345(+)